MEKSCGVKYSSNLSFKMIPFLLSITAKKDGNSNNIKANRSTEAMILLRNRVFSNAPPQLLIFISE